MNQLIKPPEQPYLTAPIRFEIRHQIAGRVRIRIAPRERMQPPEAVAAALQRIDGIWKVRANPKCSSFVLHHHPDRPIGYGDIALALGLPDTIGSQPGNLPSFSISKPRRYFRHRMPTRLLDTDRRPRRMPPARSSSDCRLCQLKLAAARWMFKDLWRCWRNDMRRQAQLQLAKLRWRLGLRY